MESSFDCYTPLERPTANQPLPVSALVQPSAVVDREDGECDTDSDSPPPEESSSDSEGNAAPKRAIILPRRKRIAPPISAAAATNASDDQLSQGNPARKKYDIWSEKIREDSLTETMRNFGVNRDGAESRHIEWYDYKLGNRFAKDGTTNRLKRRRGSGGGPGRRRSEDPDEDDDDSNDMDMDCGGKRVCYNNNNNHNSKQNRPRLLEDLEANEEATLEEVGKEIALKLKETNEALIVQVTTVLGREFVHSVYKETQRIEEDGGMMIRGNRRRRTSGGVFLFLVKHSDEIDENKKREAFKPIVVDESSEEASAKRDEEIEELKKSLITQDKDSPKMRPRTDSIRAQENASLSNPPPSPVAPVAEEEELLNNIAGSGTNNDHMDFN